MGYFSHNLQHPVTLYNNFLFGILIRHNLRETIIRIPSLFNDL
jgi:hypothetical protein